MMRIHSLLAIALLGLGPSAFAVTTVPVVALDTPPVVDGDLSEWPGDWQTIAIQPALEGDSKNRTGELVVQLKVGVVEERIFFAARWPDSAPDTAYKPWEWKKKKYKRAKDRDDMFAVRFDLAGDFNTCMIEDADYQVDVWLWSAGRSNQKGYANDMWHLITQKVLENAAEFDTPSGKKVYIKKSADAGMPGFENNKPKRRNKFEGDVLSGIELTRGPKGSIADVAAKGVWKDGFWHLELSRLLHTGHDDDVTLAGIDTKRGQIAVFNKGFAEHKSVSEELLFSFPAR